MKAYQGVLVLALVLGIWGQESNAAIVRIITYVHVLTVGINAYESNPLKYAVADAQAMGITLKRGAEQVWRPSLNRVELVELVDQQATKGAILQAVNQAAEAVEAFKLETFERQESAKHDSIPSIRAETVFVFFFSGHMSPGPPSCLVPYNVTLSDQGEAKGTMICADELRTVLEKVPATHRLWIFDSNHVDIDSCSYIAPDYIEGAHVLQATIQRGHAFEGKGHGWYTAALLQALQNWADVDYDQDGRVSVRELAAAVGHQLPVVSVGRQFPTSRLCGPGDFPLAGSLDLGRGGK